MEISDLRNRQDLLPVAAHRIWTAWWEHSGVSYDQLKEKLREVALGEGQTFSLVAHDGDGFAGTASVIPSDMEYRPQYSPWVAAVWVEESQRGRGLGSRLVREAMRQAYERGAKSLYLCARPTLTQFYSSIGWSILEHGVGHDRLTVFIASNIADDLLGQ